MRADLFLFEQMGWKALPESRQQTHGREKFQRKDCPCELR